MIPWLPLLAVLVLAVVLVAMVCSRRRDAAVRARLEAIGRQRYPQVWQAFEPEIEPEPVRTAEAITDWTLQTK